MAQQQRGSDEYSVAAAMEGTASDPGAVHAEPHASHTEEAMAMVGPADNTLELHVSNECIAPVEREGDVVGLIRGGQAVQGRGESSGACPAAAPSQRSSSECAMDVGDPEAVPCGETPMQLADKGDSVVLPRCNERTEMRAASGSNGAPTQPLPMDAQMPAGDATRGAQGAAGSAAPASSPE